MSLQRISKAAKAEQFALWAIFTSWPGGRLLEYSNTSPFVISKFMPCSVRIPWLPQPCREYMIFITLSSQVFFTRWFFLDLLLTVVTKTHLIFFFSRGYFSSWTRSLNLSADSHEIILCEIESTKAKIFFSLPFFFFFPVCEHTIAMPDYGSYGWTSRNL